MDWDLPCARGCFVLENIEAPDTIFALDIADPELADCFNPGSSKRTNQRDPWQRIVLAMDLWCSLKTQPFKQPGYVLIGEMIATFWLWFRFVADGILAFVIAAIIGPYEEGMRNLGINTHLAWRRSTFVVAEFSL